MIFLCLGGTPYRRYNLHNFQGHLVLRSQKVNYSDTQSLAACINKSLRLTSFLKLLRNQGWNMNNESHVRVSMWMLWYRLLARSVTHVGSKRGELWYGFPVNYVYFSIRKRGKLQLVLIEERWMNADEKSSTFNTLCWWCRCMTSNVVMHCAVCD